jgi:hypothetical protein
MKKKEPKRESQYVTSTSVVWNGLQEASIECLIENYGFIK